MYLALCIHKFLESKYLEQASENIDYDAIRLQIKQPSFYKEHAPRVIASLFATAYIAYGITTPYFLAFVMMTIAFVLILVSTPSIIFNDKFQRIVRLRFLFNATIMVVVLINYLFTT